jgi:hypothetical protein
MRHRPIVGVFAANRFVVYVMACTKYIPGQNNLKKNNWIAWLENHCFLALQQLITNEYQCGFQL